MKISSKGVSLIKEFEGLRLDAYYCSSNVLTIGYGSTGAHVKPGMTITRQAAEELLLKDLVRFEEGVNDLISIKLNQEQFDALVSFAFNCGVGALSESTLRKRLNKGEDPNTVAKEELIRWTNGGLAGLVRRRKAEIELFCSGSDCSAPKKVTNLTATHDTLLKKEPIAGSELAADQKKTVQKGKVYQQCTILKEESGHVQVELGYSCGTWWVFPGHWAELDGELPAQEAAAGGDICLKVPEWLQTDNYTQAERTCNSSSCAMCLKFFKPDAIKSDDEYIRKLISGGYGDTTDHGAQTNLLKSYGLNSSWHTNLSFKDLETELKAGRPVVIGILHRGTLSAPTGGHMLVVRGLKANGDFIVNDPYGSVNDGYSGPAENGKGAIYSRKMLQSRWLPEGPTSGWGRKFQP
ncbi:MAG: glycoside hydrolase family protein [Polynucleobacter sp.]